MHSNDIVIAAVVLVVVLTLIAFACVQYINYNRKATVWNLLNLMAGITIALTLNSIIPQFLLLGRTEAECHLLHHWSGSFYNITNGLARVFFQCRSNQIAPHTKLHTFIGKFMIGVIVICTLLALVWNNIAMTTTVVEPHNLCVGRPDMIGALLMVLIAPMIIDIAINVRFFKHLLQTTRQVSEASKSHSKAPMRLLKVTFMLSVSCTTMSFICMCFLFGFLPLGDPSFGTVLLAAEQAYTACALAWPSIYVFIRKRIKSHLKLTHTEDTAFSSKSKPIVTIATNQTGRAAVASVRQ